VILRNAPSYDVRSKNAGPFWLTLDIFCDDEATYRRLCADGRLSTEAVAALLGGDPALVRLFHIDALQVIKISLPRPTVQGAVEDRDMHGAQWANLIKEELDRD
jgi:hypothetical protein